MIHSKWYESEHQYSSVRSLCTSQQQVPWAWLPSRPTQTHEVGQENASKNTRFLSVKYHWSNWGALSVWGRDLLQLMKFTWEAFIKGVLSKSNISLEIPCKCWKRAIVSCFLQLQTTCKTEMTYMHRRDMEADGMSWTHHWTTQVWF